jgi:hypothetical protein
MVRQQSGRVDAHCPFFVRHGTLRCYGEGMRLFRHRNWLLFALILGLSACQGAPLPHGQQSSRPTVTGPQPPSDPQRCARLAKRGFTPCPPTPDRLPLPPTTIRNATNGAVSDATAQQWGRAFQLTEAYYRWALQHNARGALTAGLLANEDAQTVGNLFGTDLQDLDSAKRAGGTLVYDPPSIPVTQVVAITTDLRASMQRQGLQPSQFGLAARFAGPTGRAIHLPDGRDQEIISRDSAYSVDGLIWGELKADPDLGVVWYEYGNYGCDGIVRNVCQL